jgi:hypothetical protein
MDDFLPAVVHRTPLHRIEQQVARGRGKACPATPRTSSSPSTGWPNAGVMTNSSNRARTISASTGCPHHQVAMFGSSGSSPRRVRHRRGMNAAKAGASSNSTPGQLVISSPPEAQASNMSGTPMVDRASKLSGSSALVSIQRHTASIRFGPAIVRM